MVIDGGNDGLPFELSVGESVDVFDSFTGFFGLLVGFFGFLFLGFLAGVGFDVFAATVGCAVGRAVGRAV